MLNLKGFLLVSFCKTGIIKVGCQISSEILTIVSVIFATLQYFVKEHTLEI